MKKFSNLLPLFVLAALILGSVGLFVATPVPVLAAAPETIDTGGSCQYGGQWVCSSRWHGICVDWDYECNPPPPEVCNPDYNGDEDGCGEPPEVCNPDYNGDEDGCGEPPEVDPCIENPAAEGCVPPVIVTPIPPGNKDPWDPFWCYYTGPDTRSCKAWLERYGGAGESWFDQLVAWFTSK